MKKTIISIFMLSPYISSFGANGDSFTQGVLTYTVMSEDDKELSVKAANTTIKGDVVIPSIVNYDGKEYKVTSISDGAFSACSLLTSIIIPNSVNSLGEYAFQNCITMNSISIPETITNIGVCTFEHCRSLTSVDVPNSVLNIGGRAFANCTKLTTINIPNSVLSIGSSVFYKCSSLTNICIPNSVTSLGTDVFYGCENLTSVTLPDSIVCIGSRLFYQCKSLSSIVIPNAVTTIGEYAFFECVSLVTLDMPDFLTTIDYMAFYGCLNLPVLSLPASVETIGNYAFQKCLNLKTIKSYRNTPPRCYYGTFYNTPSYMVVYVPKKCIYSYAIANGWDYCSDFREMGSVNICLSNDTLNLNVDTSYSLAYYIEKGEDVIIESMSWLSSNPEVAIVNDQGVVSGVSIGDALITCTLVDNYGETHVAECRVMVTDNTTDVISIKCEELDTLAEYYNLHGKRVPYYNLHSGIYLMHIGNIVKMIMIR